MSINEFVVETIRQWLRVSSETFTIYEALELFKQLIHVACQHKR